MDGPFIGGFEHNMAAKATADANGATAFAAYTAFRMLWPVGRRLFWHVHDKAKGILVQDQDAGIDLSEEEAEALRQQQQQQMRQQMQQQDQQQRQQPLVRQQEQLQTPINSKVKADESGKIIIYSKSPDPKQVLLPDFDEQAKSSTY